MGVAHPLTLLALLEHGARWFSNSEAVLDARFRLTYAELDDQVRRCAALFRELGARPAEPLAILAPPCAYYFVAFFAAAHIGAIPVALHTRESGQAMASACRRLGARLLVFDGTCEAHAAIILADKGEIVNAVRIQPSAPAAPSSAATNQAAVRAVIPDDLDKFEPAESPADVSEDDPACIVLSSGSSSTPKGIIHTHRGLIELARSNVYLYEGLYPTDRSLVLLSPAFIGCYNSWLPFLNVGGCCVCVEKFDVATCVSKIASERVTHAILTPSVWRMILNAGFEPGSFASLRQVGCGAEVLDARTLERIRTSINPNIVQVYGATEAGAPVTCIMASEMIGDQFTSVGRAFINADIRIVRPGGGPADEVEPGVVGEVLASTVSMAAGVWRDPELTEQVFISDGPRRWWRSRDLGRLDPDGFLYIEGRRDDMIISGGINIQPAHVEAVLMRHPGVKECAVVGIPHPDWGQQVQAFVIAAGRDVTAELLEQFAVQSELSSYQRPRAYHFVAELPRTATNKINRRVLREQSIPGGVAVRS